MANLAVLYGFLAPPFPHCGLILRRPGSRLSANEIDKFVFPGFQGTPDFGTIAAKAVALGGALRPEFRTAMDRVVCFAKLFADAFTEYGVRLVAGGTDTHMVLVDLSDGDASGRTVSHALEQVGILANMNLIPHDRRSAHETSGLRLGTNHLAFMDIGEHQVGELARGVAELVADLNRGRLPEQCPAWRRLGEHAATLTGSGHQAAAPSAAAAP